MKNEELTVITENESYERIVAVMEYRDGTIIDGAMTKGNRTTDEEKEAYTLACSIYRAIKAGAKFKYGSDSLNMLKIMLNTHCVTGEFLVRFLRNEGAVIFTQQKLAQEDVDICIIDDYESMKSYEHMFTRCQIVIGNKANTAVDETLSGNLLSSKKLYIPGIIIKSEGMVYNDVFYDVLECLHISEELRIPTYYAAKFMFSN